MTPAALGGARPPRPPAGSSLATLAELVGVPDLVTAAREPTGGSIGWPRLVALADEHEVVPSLWIGARERRLLEPLPTAVREHFRHHRGLRPAAAVLEDAWAANHRRNLDLLDQLVAVATIAERQGVEVIAFKGSHLLLDGVWPEGTSRTMVDLDLLAAEPGARRLHRALRSDGYDLAPVTTRSWSHHLPALRHPDRFGAIELHTEPISIGWAAALSADEVRRRAVTVERHGVTLARPSVDDAVTLALVHGWLADGHRFAGTVPLRTTLDVLRLSSQAHARHDPVEWGRVQRRLARVGRAEVLERHVAVAEAWFDAPAVGIEPGRRTRRWFDAVADPSGGPRSAAAARLRRLQFALDAGRLRRHYGPGRTTQQRVRHVARNLRARSRNPWP